MIVLLIVAVAVFAFWVGRDEERRRNALAEALGGAWRGQVLAVPCRGVGVRVVFTAAATRHHRQRWTYVEAPLPPYYPFALYVRGHVFEDDLAIQRGEMVDVPTGDAAFDREFLVEGAPADVVARLLTPEVRVTLMQHPPLKLDTVDGTLQLLVGEWHEDPARLRPWVEVVAAIVTGLREANAAADAAVPLSTGGDPYRAIADDRPLQDARAARAAEVQRLGTIKRARASAARRVAWAVSAVVLGAALLLLAIAGGL